MHLLLFLKGFFVGLIVSIPIGPMALICIRRTLSQGYISGFATSLGIAIGDCIYASIAGYSVNFIIDQVREHEHLFGVAGGIIIILLGIILLVTQSKTTETKLTYSPTTIIKTFYTAILLTLSNPINLLAFIALFSWIGAGPDIGNYDTFLIICGVFSGAVLWFNLLSLLSFILRSKLTPKMIQLLHIITSIIIILLGIIMIIKL
jgi:threonine/homoserine/homoserine lactone efflux protein